MRHREKTRGSKKKEPRIKRVKDQEQNQEQGTKDQGQETRLKGGSR
jgi:hypothetical protein